MKCSKGSEIYYKNIESPPTTTDSENPFLIHSCTFERTDNSIQGSLIYLDWNKHSDFIFESNEIKIMTTKEEYLFESIGTINKE